MRSFYIISLSLLLIAFKSEAQVWDGHVAFSEGRYEDAISFYNQAISNGSTWDWLPELIETVEARQDLGEISPVDIHHIGVIFVTELNEIQEDGTIISSEDVTAEQKEEWLVNFYLMKQVIESFSAGNWTLKIDTVSAKSTYELGSDLKPDNPDHLNTEYHFFETIHDSDSYITLSNTRSPARGLARQYPIINGAVYGPHRGMAAVNAGTHNFSILIHEFFHIIEWVSDAIEVTHGYYEENRHNFPDWTGITEFDYYRWHFAETLPDAGWDLMQHRDRWLPFKWSEAAQQTIIDEMQEIPLETRRDGYDLYDSARSLLGEDPEGAIALMEEALEMNPYRPAILLELLEYYRLEEVNSEKSGLYAARLEKIRDAGAWYWQRDETRELGEVVGMWHPENMSDPIKFFTFDVTDQVNSPGRFEATFYYLEGWNGAEIDSVYLLENEIEVSSDIHFGQTGNVKTNHIYTLELNEYDPDANYTLKAYISQWGNGTDSKGQIHFIQRDTFEVADVTHTNPLAKVLFYPNPSEGTVYLSQNHSIEQLIVYSSKGEVILQRGDLKNEECIDLGNLTAGIYQIKCLIGEKWMAFRLMRK